MKKFLDAHSRYEAAMASIKSMNLPEGEAAWRDAMLTSGRILDSMEMVAFSVELLAVCLEQSHVPDTPAPNPINKKGHIH